MAIAAGLEGAVHSHARRALEAGATRDEVRHVGLLALTTIGFPRMIAGLIGSTISPRAGWRKAQDRIESEEVSRK